VLILAMVGILIQIFAGESKQLELVPLLAPFLFITLPMLSLCAALAVLFETIRFTSGGLGNVIYFFLFIMILPLSDTLSKTNPALDPLGFGLLQQSMGAAAKAAYPGYDGGFLLGSSDTPIQGIFHWSGVTWTPDLILQRLTSFGIAILLVLLASLFFDRFDPSRGRPRQAKRTASLSTTDPAPIKQALSQPVQLTRLINSQTGSTFIRVLISELKLLLKGQRWWWYAIVVGLFIASLASTPENVRAYVLPIAWIWPILIWSGLGNREINNNTYQMVFSSAAPLTRQLPASWLAGFIITVLVGSGAALKLLAAGDGVGLLAWFSAALFIPSFALALGVWSKGNKLFEVLYVAMWYVGPMNNVYPVDYIGTKGNGNIEFFIPFSLVLIILAFIGRARQLRN